MISPTTAGRYHHSIPAHHYRSYYILACHSTLNTTFRRARPQCETTIDILSHLVISCQWACWLRSHCWSHWWQKSLPCSGPGEGGRIRFSSPSAARRRTMTRNFVSHLVNFYKDQGLWSEPLEECRKYFKKFFKTLVTKWRDDSHSRLDVGLWIALISRQNTVWPGHQLPTGPTGPHSQLHSGQSVCVRTASSQLRFTKIEVEIRAMARPSPLTGRPKPKFVFVLQLGFVVQFLSCQNGWKGRICTDVRIVEDPLPPGNLPFQSGQDLCLSFYLLPAREREAGVVLL